MIIARNYSSEIFRWIFGSVVVSGGEGDIARRST